MPARDTEPCIFEIASNDSFVEIERMMRALYEQFATFGASSPLADEGERVWVRGIQPTLGRSSVLYMAKIGESAVGFAHGSLRLQPSHLARQKIGFVTHIYVDPEVRGRAVGRRLALAVQTWLRDRGAVAIELHVVKHNERALLFWSSLGYGTDLVQLRKTLVSP